MKAGRHTDTQHDTLAQYSWPHSISWYLAEGYRNGDHHHPMGPCGSGRSFYLYNAVVTREIKLFQPLSTFV